MEPLKSQVQPDLDSSKNFEKVSEGTRVLENFYRRPLTSSQEIIFFERFGISSHAVLNKRENLSYTHPQYPHK